MQWYFADGQTQRGPVETEALSGRIGPQTLVWREGMAQWLPASQVAELASVLPQAQNWQQPQQPAAYAQQPAAYGQQPHGAQPMMYDSPMYNTARTPGMAIASMVCGIVSIPMTCAYGIGFILAVLAIIFGFIARNQGAANGNPGTGQAKAGIILGFVEIGLLVALIAVIVILGLNGAFN